MQPDAVFKLRQAKPTPHDPQAGCILVYKTCVPVEAIRSEQVIRNRGRLRREFLLSLIGAGPDILRGFGCDISASLFLPV